MVSHWSASFHFPGGLIVRTKIDVVGQLLFLDDG